MLLDLTLKNYTLCQQIAYFFVWLSEQTTIISLYGIKLLVVRKGVYLLNGTSSILRSRRQPHSVPSMSMWDCGWQSNTYVFNPTSISVSPVNIMPLILHIHFHLHTALTRTNGWSLGTFKKQCCVGNKGVVYKKKSTTPRRTDWPSVVMWLGLDRNCALLGCYAASSGNSFSDVSKQPIGPLFIGQESKKPSWILYPWNGTDRSSQNVGKQLPLRGGSLMSLWCDLLFKGRGVYMVLVGKPEGKRPLGRPRRRWEDNIRMDLQEVGLGYEDWIGLAQDRDRWRALVSAVRNLRVP